MNKNSSSCTTSARESEHARDGRGDGSTSPAFRSLPPLNFTSQPQPPGTPATVRQMAPAGLLSPLKIFGQAKRYIRLFKTRFCFRRDATSKAGSNVINRFCLFALSSIFLFPSRFSSSQENQRNLRGHGILQSGIPQIPPRVESVEAGNFAAGFDGVHRRLREQDHRDQRGPRQRSHESRFLRPDVKREIHRHQRHVASKNFALGYGIS